LLQGGFISALIEKITALAGKAGAAILEVYSGTDFGTTYKEGGSPLTRADMAANAVIVEGLRQITPDIPILSEESKAAPFETRSSWARFWMVDPLDGTKEFIKRNDEFTVNIALIDHGTPILGVVLAPALGVTYFGSSGSGGGAFKTGSGSPEPISVAGYESGPVNIVASRSHGGEALERFVSRIGPVRLVPMGSSLKLCLVADGTAHIYPRFGPTMEWDTAAAHAVLEAAGGLVTDLSGRPLKYNKEDLLNPHFMATGVPAFPWQDFLD
jgi:3'(2'), 5'-bisphosphate nucleotidase